ncbi:7803_t:CDS:10 [Ambispora gerdemannii]|uniref:7803_t:CDS:1 n=1 Tax=Ambispora gerdemannii TaxID=144530 RepID=A0A9N9FV24_9GLOM|nr:7803_t:CDS:10 [Ambispora gerdemannii]
MATQLGREQPQAAQVQHQSSTHMMKTTKSGRPFVKDIHDLFSTLIVSLPMDSHRHMFRSYPNTFTTEEAVLNLNMAKSVCQTFMDAKLFEHATDSTNRTFRDKNLYALTPKGVYVLEKFMSRNGIVANNLSKMFASYSSPIRLYFLERNPDNDSILLNKSAIEAVFRRFLGLYPNDTTSGNSNNNTEVISDSSSNSSSEKGDRNLGIELKERQQNHKTYRHTFYGLSALDWLCDFSTAIARDEASKIANEFLRIGLIEPVPEKKSEKQQHEQRFSRSTLYQVTDEGRYIAGWEFDLQQSNRNNHSNNGLRGILSMANLNKAAADASMISSHGTTFTTKSHSKGKSIDSFPTLKQESNTKRLQQILEDSTLCSLLMEFLKANFCEENLIFLLDVKNFKSKYGNQLNETEQKNLISDVFRIYNNYLAPVCPIELNIEHSLKQQITQYMTSIESHDQQSTSPEPPPITVNLYDKLEDTIFRLLASDSIPRFIRTDKYLNAVYGASAATSSSPPKNSSRSITPESQMATTYTRPLQPQKRVKLVSTCDNCKTRKVRCDKVRPSCGACTKTARNCSYVYSAHSQMLRESGGNGAAANRAQQMQEKLNELQRTQERKIDQTQNFISMFMRGYEADVNNQETFQGFFLRPELQPLQQQQENPIPMSQGLAQAVLQHSTEIASKIHRITEQCEVPPELLSQPPSQEINQSIVPNEQLRIHELTTAFEELNIYQSTRYIGEGSLLLIGDEDDNKEKFIPQGEQDLSAVRESLKYLPDPETVDYLISLYYQHLHRYTPFLRKQVVRNALQNLSKPQHLLLLNCVFFAASPFHEDPARKDGRVYFERAEALLFEYCRTQPHVLTVIATVLLGHHNKQPVAGWMYNGIATKMLFELGLHRKMKNVKIKLVNEVARLRNEAFWITFISENFISAAYGRPNMIEENDCDVDELELPDDLNPPDEDSRLYIAFVYCAMLNRICVKVRKYMHNASRMKLIQEDENKFRLLDAQLGNWFQGLPQWLTFTEMSKDLNGSLLNGIGGDLHLFFYTVLILLHSRHLKTQGGAYSEYTIYPPNAPVTCTQAAKIIVTWLDILLSNVPEFFAHSICGPFAINPAMRVFRWNAQHGPDANDPRAAEVNQKMVENLETIKVRVAEISRKYDRGRENGDNQNSSYSSTFMWLGNPDSGNVEEGFDIGQREGEVYIADNDSELRSQYRKITWKTTGSSFGRRRSTRGSSIGGGSRQMSWTSISGSSQNRQMSWTSNAGPSRRMSSYSSTKCYANGGVNRWYTMQSGPLNEEPQSFTDEDLNFTFLTDKKIEFSSYDQQQSPDIVEVEERQKREQELFEPDDSSTSSNYISPQLSSSTYSSPLLLDRDSIISSPSSAATTTNTERTVRPHEIEKNQSQASGDLQQQLTSQPPLIQQSEQGGTQQQQYYDFSYVIWSPPVQIRNPLRTTSNSSSTSVMPTPPLGPNDEELFGPSLDDFADDGFWDVLKNAGGLHDDDLLSH